MTDRIALNGGYSPGVIAAVIALHMDYYAPVWGFGVRFETKLAREMAEFHERLDPARDLFLAARNSEGAVLGSITIDGALADTERAHLRWFIVDRHAMGSGIGKTLMSRA